jgi:ribosomal protein L34
MRANSTAQTPARVKHPAYSLLTAGTSNPKTAKTTDERVVNAVLHLAPADASGYEVCQFRTAGCTAGCLNTAGRGGIPRAGFGEHLNAIQAARVGRTKLFFEDRPTFWRLLRSDIDKLRRVAAREESVCAVRLNGTSDLPWHRIRTDSGRTILEEYPDVQFYDYTKRPVFSALPPNYHLTFSYAGPENVAHADGMLVLGVNVAVVFDTPRGKDLPEQWHGFRVIDGDKHDLRFLDPDGVVVGLRAKGRARKDTSGFVVRAA